MERHWITRAKAGDRLAFGRLVRHYQDGVYRYALYFVGDSDLAQELAQETFYKFYKTLDRFDADKPVKPWLFRIAASLCKDQLKRKKIEVPYPQGGDSPGEESFGGL